jgi:ubiquinone/menaquinone biosynthesis C-methylase UbiE
MGFYSRVIFPWFIDWGMSMAYISKARRAALAGVCGEVLEIGFGTGLNLPHYPEQVHKITTVDVNAGMDKRAQKRINNSSITVDNRVLNGETLPMDDNTYDSVVSTWTMCSIENVGRALAEIRRVLKPDGKFFFLEHGLSNEAKIQRWQHRLGPLQKIIGDGCRLDLNIKELIEQQDFKIIECNNYYIEKTPKPHGFMYQGIATRR